jgi:membrane protease YdiL (CAAX protease family)
MKFLDLAKLGRTSVGLYVGGVALLIILYILGNLPLLFDLQYNYNGLLFDPENPMFISTYGSVRLLFAMLLPFVLVFFGLVLYLRFAHQRPVLSIFTTAKRFRWWRFFFFSGFLLLFFFTTTFLEAQLTGDTQQIRWNFKFSEFWPLLCVGGLMIPLQAAAEELIFRVYALQGLYLRTKSAWASILISALLFAFMHISNPEIAAMGYELLLYYLMAGIFLALISVQDDGLELALAFHIFNNLFGVLVVSSSWHVFHTEALFLDQRPPGSLLLHLGSGLFIFAGLYFILAKKFNWKPLRTLR